MSKRTNTPARLLVVGRDTRYGEWLRHHLGVLCPDSVVSALDLEEFERLSEELSSRDCDVLLLAAPFGASPEDPQAQGLQLLRRWRGRPQFPAVIVVAEDGNELTAVRALQLGATDYLPKRLLTPERLGTSVKMALRRIEKRATRRVAALIRPPAAEALPLRAKVQQAAVKEATLNIPEKLALADQSLPAKSAFFPYGAEFVGPGESLQITPSELPRVARAAAIVNEAGMTDAQTAAAAEPEKQPSNSTSSSDVEAGPAEQDALLEAMPADDAAPPDELAVQPDFLPGYTIHAKVGESEKAAVYVATSALLARKVALKVSKTLRDEAAGRQFLEREYTAIVAIRNPSVVQIFDYGVHAGYEYLVMEYFPRGDLKARLQQGLTELEALGYVEQIATGLRVVHHAGLLHRDLKPPNVMLRENGDVALIDFGLARALDGSTPSTRVGVLRGSPYYMSPEQALGEELDARSDFYSLGIMFYEMLTGRKPYTGGSAMEVLQQHVNAPVPQLPKPLSQYEPLLSRLVAKSREERFSSASEIIAAVVTAREISQVEPSAA